MIFSPILHPVGTVSAEDPDTTAPIISLIGSSTVTITVGDTYTDAGATALDETDGDITANITVSSDVDTNTVGTYSVSYTVADLAGNTAASSRVVNVISVVDTTAPVITIIGSSTVTITVGDTYTDAGATALDDIDGDITANLTVSSDVDTNTVGTYTVEYSVADAAGNVASSTRTVIVVDTTAPVITLIGSSTVTITVGDVYADQGATALDDVDGDITANITSTSTVSTSTPGTYSVNYFVTDAAGNIASTTRTVIVNALPGGGGGSDTIAPTITLIGSSTVTVNVGDTYTDAGATALDDVDGDITANITVSSDVDTNNPGTYTVEYSVADLAGNVASSTRTVIVNALPSDTTAPVITLIGSSTVTITVGDTYTDQGATALDETDGDITANITSTSTVSTSTPGTYTVEYTIADAAGNVASSTRTVIVNALPSDTTAPVITITGSSTITISVGDTYTDQGATALDETDGDITANITSTSTVSTAAPGTYTVTYSVSDAAGNVATSSRIVNVVDITAPVITLIGSSTITISVGDTYIDQGATALDETDGDITANITSTSTVSTSTPGTYTVEYSVADQAGNVATTSRTVIVNALPSDTTAPVITLIGSSTVTITVGDTYTDQGATALDETDGDITANITSTSTVSTSTPGTYTVEYTVSDAAGNVATTSRTVIVNALPSDTTAPVITLIGSSTVTITVGDTYTDQGATALDETDGDITTNITSTSTVSTSTPGTYTVEYTVSDAAGNVATTSRTVIVNALPGGGGGSDTIAPVITLIGSSTISINVGSTYVDQGATALDDVDGDITADIVASSTVDTNTVGTYSVNYFVTDAAGNVASSTRTVIVNALPSDTTAPVITLIGSSTVTITVGDVYADQGATALDDVDGDITANITSTSTVSTSTPGTYTVEYSVADLAGNVATSSRIVNVVDTIAPVITLIGSSTVTLTVGDVYADQGATALDDVDGDITANLVSSSTVDNNTPGTYSVIYTVSDAAGNVASTTRTVIVTALPSDVTAPVITIIGSSTVTITVGDTYTDAGATALDETDGDITANILASSTVDTNTPGTYSVNYFVTDAAGNIASTTRTVIVNALPGGGGGGGADTIAPTITLIGSSTITISVGDTYIDQGATALDETDGDITANIISTSTVSTAAPGTYSVNYFVTDAAGNVATTSRTVIVVDITAPVITITGSSTITITVGDIYTDAGATALDETDGDITANLISSSTVDTNTPGTYTVEYTVSDAAGNVASTTRTVIVTALPGGGGGGGGGSDTTAPVITITGSSIITISVGDIYTDAGATALDETDGDITANLVSSSTVDTNTPGTYSVNYFVTDAAGNVATTSRTVIVVDITAPTITLIGSSTITITVGDTYTDQGATALDDVDGDITANITSTSTVSTVTPGTYTVEYTVSDAAGNVASTTRTVIVVDTTAPTITLIGSSTVTITVGDAYTDQGATALDETDGDITANITSTSTVSTSTPGTYTVEYSVADQAGNVATSSRTVIVNALPSDTTAPVITIIGSSTVTISVGDTYIDQGATALDETDGDITANILASSTVDTNTAGTYFVFYSVSDSAGNNTSSSRQVTVIAATIITPPVTPPVVTRREGSRSNVSRSIKLISPISPIASSTLLATTSYAVLDKTPVLPAPVIPSVTLQKNESVTITTSKVQEVIGEAKNEVTEPQDTTKNTAQSPSSESTTEVAAEEVKLNFWQKTYRFFKKIVSYVVNIGS